jgi:hypothetical protein
LDRVFGVILVVGGERGIIDVVLNAVNDGTAVVVREQHSLLHDFVLHASDLHQRAGRRALNLRVCFGQVIEESGGIADVIAYAWRLLHDDRLTYADYSMENLELLIHKLFPRQTQVCHLRDNGTFSGGSPYGCWHGGKQGNDHASILRDVLLAVNSKDRVRGLQGQGVFNSQDSRCGCTRRL